MASGRDIAGKGLVADDADTEDVRIFRQVGQRERPIGFADGLRGDGGILAENGDRGGWDGLLAVGHSAGKDGACRDVRVRRIWAEVLPEQSKKGKEEPRMRQSRST